MGFNRLSKRQILKVEVKPPDKLSVLHGYSSEGHLQPTTWFYCLPEEVEILKKKALDDTLKPKLIQAVEDFKKGFQA